MISFDDQVLRKMVYTVALVRDYCTLKECDTMHTATLSSDVHAIVWHFQTQLRGH